jgi:hypothetical protein
MSRYWRRTAVLVLAGFFATGAALAQKVAILGAPNTASWNDDVQAKLQATGKFAQVDIINVATTTPTLPQLQAYQAVLLYTDGACCADSTTLGNNLADYVDAGGGVVAAVFATASIPIAGRFNTSNYWAIQPTGQQSSANATLGTIYLPGSPILAGVATFDGGSSSYRPSTSNLHPNATRVADWSGAGTIPLIATRVINGKNRVDLGFFPPSTDARSDFWVASTDGAKIMANALVYVGAAAQPQVVPTLDPVALVLLAALLAGATWWLQRRRAR